MMEGKTTGYLDMELLRFTTAGSVDDGKSTLIGRLLYDSKAIFEDQMDAIKRVSAKEGDGEGVNLALLTDGLRAEREQGITIDVAYRYFATPRRKFIIADTPGHIQYTRNMVTGASTANAACILIDARNGVIEQTRRHAFIASLLNIPHIVVCINKMDLVDFSEDTFEHIKTAFEQVAQRLGLKDLYFIPMSAKYGDNVVENSEHTPWYSGKTFLETLETIPIQRDHNLKDARFPVQYVVRPQKEEYHDFRGYAGSVVSGIFKPGDEVKVLPSGLSSKVKSIVTFENEEAEAVPPQSVTITLEDDIDVSRGDMIVAADNCPQVAQGFDLRMCWLSERAMQTRGKYLLRHTTNEVVCIVEAINYKVDINTLEELKEEGLTMGLNDIGCVRLKTAKPIFFDSYSKNRATGSVILIDQATNETVAAGMIL